MVFSTGGEGGGPVLGIPGGLVVLEGEAARVARVLNTQGPDADLVDLTEGDVILFLNGTRITSADQLTELYQAVEAEAEVKLGIQRGEAKMIRTFSKPEMQVQAQPGGGGNFSFSTAGDAPLGGAEAEHIQRLENQAPWGAGFLIGEEEGKVVVALSFPMPKGDPALEDVAAGDVITRINGTEITSATQLNEVYGALDVGAAVRLELQRDGGAKTLQFKKPQDVNMQIRVNGQ